MYIDWPRFQPLLLLPSRMETRNKSENVPMFSMTQSTHCLIYNMSFFFNRSDMFLICLGAKIIPFPFDPGLQQSSLLCWWTCRLSSTDPGIGPPIPARGGTRDYCSEYQGTQCSIFSDKQRDKMYPRNPWGKETKIYPRNPFEVPTNDQ